MHVTFVETCLEIEETLLHFAFLGHILFFDLVGSSKLGEIDLALENIPLPETS